MKFVIAVILFVFATPDGQASWYGVGNWHGSVTANGEDFDPSDYTCAHRTADFNTYLLVVNMKTGNFAVCRVNDRGPYPIEDGDPVVDNSLEYYRVVDVTPVIAEQLNMKSSGTIPVKLYKIRREAP